MLTTPEVSQMPRRRNPLIAYRTSHSLAKERVCNPIIKSHMFANPCHQGAGFAAPGDQTLYFAIHKAIPECQAMDGKKY